MQTYNLIRESHWSHLQKNRKPPCRIALIADLSDHFTCGANDPPDAGAKFDK